MIEREMGAGAWGLLVTLSVLWGGSFFFAEVALAELPPLTVVLGRVALAALALLAALRIAGLRLPTDRRSLGRFAVMGGLNNMLPFSLIVWGQTEIAGGLAAILNATTPLFTVLLAHVLTADERFSGGRLAGVGLGFAGVVAMIGPAALAGLGASVLAQLAVLAAALSYACAGIYGRRFRGEPPLVTAAGQVTASALLLAPVALLAERPWTLPMPGLATIGALAGIALFSTALAYVIYFRVLARAGATNLLLVTFLIPASAILLGVLVLGEALTPAQLAGLALIGLGLAAIDGRPLRRLARRSGRRSARRASAG